MSDFRTDILTWVSKVGGRLESIPKIAAAKVAYESRKPRDQGGPMPVVTGNLRNSMVASHSGPSPANIVMFPGHPQADKSSDIAIVINSTVLGQHIFLSYTASYAGEAEKKYAFVRLPAQEWTNYVEAAVKSIGAP